MLKGKSGFYPEAYAEIFEPLSSDEDNTSSEDEVTPVKKKSRTPENGAMVGDKDDVQRKRQKN